MTANAATGRTAFGLLRLGRRIAAELAGEAVDPEVHLPFADRHALVALAIAVDEEAAHRAGAEPLTERARVWLADQLAPIERGFPEPIPRSSPTGDREAIVIMLKLEILRWTVVFGLAAALVRWPRPGALFWALASGRPFVVTRRHHGDAGRFREACPG